MQVSNAELGPWHVHRQVNLASPRQVLDVAVSSMLRPAGDCSCPFLGHLARNVFICRAGVSVQLKGKIGHRARKCICLDKLSLASIPLGQNLMGGGAAENTGMNEAGEFDAWNVS